VGTGVGYVALLVLTLRYLHSSWAVAAVLLADFLPSIALGGLFGVWADRYAKRTLIVTANVVAAGAWAGLALVHEAAAVIGLALLAGIGNAMLRPALRAALPVIAGDATQAAAAWYDSCRWLGLTAGPVIAAGLFALSGVRLPLALNALSFVLAAAVMATVAIAGTPAHSVASSTGSGLRAGLSVAFSFPGVAPVVLCAAGCVLAGGLLNVCEPLLATHVLHGSGSDFALLVACYGAGMVVATALVSARGKVAAPVLTRRFLDALTLLAAGMFASAIVASVGLAMVAFAVTGFANALLLVSAVQLIQLRVPAGVQGRLFGAKDSLEATAYLIGLVGAGLFAVSTEGVRLTLAVGAGVCALCAIVAIATIGLRRSQPLAPNRSSVDPLI
jgi:DHA3 family macrolide efflux protein-like MFS transporter